VVQYFAVPPPTLQDRGASASPRAPYAKSRETRARILAAALAEASDSGFHKTSVARIAARAGVAVGNLNYHFGSRRALLRELMGSLIVDLMARLQAAASQDGADFFARQRAEVIAYLEYLRANPAHIRLADEIKLHEPGLYRRAVAQWVERITQRLREGIASGAVRAMDDAEIVAQAHFLLGARHFVEQMIEGGDGLDDEAVVDAYLGLIRDGLSRRSRTGDGKGRAR